MFSLIFLLLFPAVKICIKLLRRLQDFGYARRSDHHLVLAIALLYINLNSTILIMLDVSDILFNAMSCDSRVTPCCETFLYGINNKITDTHSHELRIPPHPKESGRFIFCMGIANTGKMTLCHHNIS
jgi:hypothetical protein